MSWRDMLDNGFQGHAENERRKKEEKEAKEREEKARINRDKAISRSLVPRIRPIYEEFMRKKLKSPCCIKVSDDSDYPDISIYCYIDNCSYNPSIHFSLSTFSTIHITSSCETRNERDSARSITHASIRLENFTEEWLVKSLLKTLP